jgi:hypothetical protein
MIKGKIGCGKSIQFLTGQNIILHTEICGQSSKWEDNYGELMLCDNCKIKLKEVSSK